MFFRWQLKKVKKNYYPWNNHSKGSQPSNTVSSNLGVKIKVCWVFWRIYGDGYWWKVKILKIYESEKEVEGLI